MKMVAPYGSWLIDLINPPPRATLSFAQKIWRVVLVTITLVTLCVIASLVLSLSFFAYQRSHEFLEGAPQVRNGITILVASILMNVACVFTLIQIKRFDEKVIPKAPRGPIGTSRH